MLTACQTTKTPTAGTKGVLCAQPPISYSREDTDQTKREVREFNAARKAVCG